jgi:hypothetical protein
MVEEVRALVRKRQAGREASHEERKGVQQCENAQPPRGLPKQLGR